MKKWEDGEGRGGEGEGIYRDAMLLRPPQDDMKEGRVCPD